MAWDVVAVRDAAREAASYVRAGNGPMLIEMKTYRYRGHSMSDPAKYRSRDEVREMRRAHDPIDRVGEDADRGRPRRRGDSQISRPGRPRRYRPRPPEFAENSAEPVAAELTTDVVA